jgi:hypothetical protein
MFRSLQTIFGGNINIFRNYHYSVCFDPYNIYIYNNCKIHFETRSKLVKTTATFFGVLKFLKFFVKKVKFFNRTGSCPLSFRFCCRGRSFAAYFSWEGRSCCRFVLVVACCVESAESVKALTVTLDGIVLSF